VEEITRVYAKEGVPSTVVLCGDFNYDPGQDGWARDDTFDPKPTFAL
jgi:endonuclease/exonuclease/phosphatase family metal-dependent hydrolase